MISTLHEFGKLLREDVANPISRLASLHRVDYHSGITERATQRRMHRMYEIAQIKELAQPMLPGEYLYPVKGFEDWEGPVVGVITWTRDCDCATGESKATIPAHIKAYDSFRESQLDWAEGPMTFRLTLASAPFRAWTRDNVLEAYEDGHPHSVGPGYSPSDGPEGCEFGYDEYQFNLKQRGL